MQTLNVCVQLYMNKKTTQNLLKLQIFPFFSETLAKLLKRREIFVIYIYIYIYIYICIYMYVYV